MKKNIFQIVIVFVTIFALSTTVMAQNKKHDYKWWTAIEELQGELSNIKEDPATLGGDDQLLAPDVSPIICPKCWFPAGPFPDNNRARLAEAYMPGAVFKGTDLSSADLFGADLRGVTMIGANLSEADLSSVNFSRMDEIEFRNPPSQTWAIFIDTNLSDAKGWIDAIGLDDENIMWLNTTCPDGSNSDTNGDGTCFGH
jgi:hypothetical protein